MPCNETGEQTKRGVWQRGLTPVDLAHVVEIPLSLRVWGNVKEALCCWPSWNKCINRQFLSCQGSRFWAPANVMLIKNKIVGCGTPESSLHVSLVLLQTKATRCNMLRTCLHQQKTHVVIGTVMVVLPGLLHLVYLMMLSMAGWTKVHSGINHKDLVAVQTLQGLTHTVCTCAQM